MMGREDLQLKLRLSEELKSTVTASAKANGRSVNAEIVAMIEAAQDGGSAEAARFKALLDDERKLLRRTTDLVDQQMDLLHSYRDILKRASAEVIQHASVVLSLCSIIESMDGPADEETIRVIERIKAGAELSKAQQEAANVRAGKEELRKLNATIAKADELLKNNDD